MRAYVAVTDIDWYRYLSSRPHIHEANFWRPYGSRPFRVLQPGEPFIFKTKAPLNKIVGGAIYEGFVSLKVHVPPSGVISSVLREDGPPE